MSSDVEGEGKETDVSEEETDREEKASSVDSTKVIDTANPKAARSGRKRRAGKQVDPEAAGVVPAAAAATWSPHRGVLQLQKPRFQSPEADPKCSGSPVLQRAPWVLVETRVTGARGGTTWKAAQRG